MLVKMRITIDSQHRISVHSDMSNSNKLIETILDLSNRIWKPKQAKLKNASDLSFGAEAEYPSSDPLRQPMKRPFSGRDKAELRWPMDACRPM